MIKIEELRTRVFELPTVRRPESDGTASWASTTMVLVEIVAAGVKGLGYSYIDAGAAKLIESILAPCVIGCDADSIPELTIRMLHAVRNQGRAGVAACAISAIDIALWDLKARRLGVSVSRLLGHARAAVPVYASGGFTSTPLDELAHEVASYVEAGHRRVKIKIGRPAGEAIERARVARGAAGADTELMVDANGAFSAKEAIELSDQLVALGVHYFEEPVSSDELDAMRLVREHAGLQVAAGEYGYDAMYFERMLSARAVDIMQADATRCLGITGFMQADTLCDAHAIPLSAHCAPALHVHPARAARRLVHVEHFFDHVRFEAMLFDGVPLVRRGELVIDDTRLGLGLELRDREASRLAA